MIEILTDIHIYAAMFKPVFKAAAFILGTTITTYHIVEMLKTGAKKS